ncbi:MAG: family 78 glycoside hydrolase catalytic domain [Clostridia bacterium]|nr:family 78 glycoside hydrolase catalytic domain [Clostridia bacterium]
MFSKKFICATYDYATYRDFVPSPLFRKTFVIQDAAQKATLTIGCAGFYNVYINGKNITKGILAPYISNPDHIVYYDEYDITDLLHPGKNVLGVQLGNGMQNAPGGEIWDFHKADFRGAPRVAFAIDVTDTEGEKYLFEADAKVKTAPSGIMFDDLRAGCFCDGRNEKENWAEIDFQDGDWDNALVAETPRGEARICEAEPITPIRELKPKKIYKCTEAPFRPEERLSKDVSDFPATEREGWLYDFGITTAGVERLKIKGFRGQKIDLQFGEYLDENGNPDISNVQFYPQGFAQRDIYVLKSDEEEIFVPEFTYHGARYCIVYGITPEQATEDLLTFTVYSSKLGERGNFRCSDTTLNRLQAMARNSTLSNFYYFPTDCPQREKNGWTGDAAISCEQTVMNFTPEKSYREWMRNIVKAQDDNGMIPGIVPTSTWGYGKGFGTAWDCVLAYIPYYEYIYRGDKTIMEESAHALFRYADFISRKRNKRGTIAYGLGDWCPVTVLKAPLEFTCSVMGMDYLEKCAYMFGVMGMTLQKEFCENLYKELRAAVRKYLIDFNSMTAAGRCQTSQSMAIYYNVFEEAEKQKAFEVLTDIIEGDGEHVDFGFIGIRPIFRVLCDFGRADLAYKMIARPGYPSYGNWVKRGYTALPENFHPENEFPDSLNHHNYSDVSAVFTRYFAGINVNPYRDDCREINIAPCFIKSIDDVTAFYDSVEGKVSVSWQKTGNEILLSVEKPDGIYGEVILPAGFVFKESKLCREKLKSGVYNIVNLNDIPENIIEV